MAKNRFKDTIWLTKSTKFLSPRNMGTVISVVERKKETCNVRKLLFPSTKWTAAHATMTFLFRAALPQSSLFPALDLSPGYVPIFPSRSVLAAFLHRGIPREKYQYFLRIDNRLAQSATIKYIEGSRFGKYCATTYVQSVCRGAMEREILYGRILYAEHRVCSRSRLPHGLGRSETEPTERDAGNFATGLLRPTCLETRHAARNI